MPVALTQEARRRGSSIKVEAFPAKGFTATFRDAVTRGDAPDVLVFDNFGIMDGITTALGRFEGIGEDPALRNHFVRVTGAFEELLGPERGWTYLFALSRNHETIRTLALRAPKCPNGSSGPKPRGDLADIVLKIATAYLNGDTSSLVAYSDADQLATRTSSREPITVGAVQPCGVWGNDKLAFASVEASYVAETTIGHTRVVLVLRKPFGQWQLLVAARDPISNGPFVKDVASLAALLPSGTETGAFPASATLLSPDNGDYPRPSHGQRFGTFAWRSSPSDDVVAEIAEFAYHNDARLFVKWRGRPEQNSQISAGQLWTTNSEWSWRIWSVSRAGIVAFSNVRQFPH